MKAEYLLRLSILKKTRRTVEKRHAARTSFQSGIQLASAWQNVVRFRRFACHGIVDAADDNHHQSRNQIAGDQPDEHRLQELVAFAAAETHHNHLQDAAYHKRPCQYIPRETGPCTEYDRMHRPPWNMETQCGKQQHTATAECKRNPEGLLRRRDGETLPALHILRLLQNTLSQ